MTIEQLYALQAEYCATMQIVLLQLRIRLLHWQIERLRAETRQLRDTLAQA